MKFNLCLTFVFSLPMLLPAFASANNLRQITSRDGLSNSSVYCLYQDDEHFLWIGTFDGLNKYDGRNINIYKPDINNQYSLSSNVIRKITETEGDYLWISTKWGLNKLSQKENIIVEYHDEFKEDSHIAKDNKGNLFVLQKPGFLSIYSKKGKTFTDIPVNQDITITNVTGLFIDANDTIWINHNGVFERYHVSDEDTLITRLSDYSHSNRIIFAAFDSGRLLFVDDSGDLYSINPQKTVFIRNISQLLEESGEISSIIYDYNDILIGFKTNGLVRLQAQDYYKIERIEINCGVFSLLKDAQQDITWIGTDGQGVYVWTKDDYTFENITLSQLPIKKQRPVRAIYTDNQNNLWLGTKDNGIIRIKNYHERQEFPAKNITHYTTDNGLQNNGVFAFAYSTAHNVLWIGSDGPGLNYFS
ncbi:MAG: hybrid sensor histidine kinase/response regulator, partial [Tannerella sp.]|nr:hybrid sensor histidine kinase/response regulator [Tannerella sp.]